MQRIQLADNLIQYQFPPRAGRHFGFNIYAMVDGKRVLLIDTGYEDHAAVVLSDLEEHRQTLRRVIVSHFHEDHVTGLKALPKVPVFGSESFAETFEEHPPDGGPEAFTPTDLLKEGSILNFGSFDLRFLETPGHSACCLCTVIDDRFIHVADNLLTSNDGEPILPFAKRQEFPNHIRSLERIRTMAELNLLPGHGVAMAGRDLIETEIDHRLRYLEAVASSSGRPSYEEATAGLDRGFLHPEWHEHHIAVV